MKFLILPLLVFFLIGTHGHAIPKEQNEETAQPGAKEYLKSVIHGVFVLGAELAGMTDSEDEEKLAHVQKRAESIFFDTYNLLHAMGQTIIDTYKEVDKEIHEQYPVYRTKVIPIVEEYFQNVIKYVVSLKDDILPHIKKANLEMMKIQLQFISDMKTFFDGHVDKLKSFREDMNVKVKPFVEQVQEELKAAKKQETDLKQLSDEQRQHYKDVMKGLVQYREEDAKKWFDIFEKYSNAHANTNAQA